jgi:hypothetical protein
MVCSLLSQSCGSGLRAITEEQPPTTADHVQDAGEASLPGALVLAPPRTDACVSGALGSMPPTELAAAVVPAYPRLFMGPFTASSGERVLLRQQRGQWQGSTLGWRGAVTHRWPVVLPDPYLDLPTSSHTTMPILTDTLSECLTPC